MKQPATYGITIENEIYSDKYGFTPDTEEKKTFFRLCTAVRRCGEAAREKQAQIHRTFKADGSILTETDLSVSETLIRTIRGLYPECGIVTEEIDLHDFRKDAKYTFIFDPIDGTDSYSQGFPMWTVAVGILDENRIPCGAVIHAPRFGKGKEDLFICTLPGDGRVFVDGKVNELSKKNDVPKQMVFGSNMLSFVNPGHYMNKLRSFCGSVLNLAVPAVFEQIDCVANPRCYVWDIAASHAVLKKSGLEVCYLDGSPVVYTDGLLVDRTMTDDIIVAGNTSCVKWMIENLKKY